MRYPGRRGGPCRGIIVATATTAAPAPLLFRGTSFFVAAAPAYTAPQSAGLEENMACALCYVLGLLTGVLFLVLEPYSRNRLIRFHAFQSIFLNIAWIVVFIALSIISVVLLPIPFLGAILSLMLHMAAGLGIFILWLMLMYKAYNKERWVLPSLARWPRNRRNIKSRRRSPRKEQA